MISSTLASALARSSRVAVLTGAGVSAESGVPTFRDPGGLWSRFRPEELANVDAFLRNPDLVWQWYQHRRRVLSDVAPNAGHVALAAMEELFPEFTLITQNVDNLHRRAGSTRVIELHGNLERNVCLDCRRVHRDITDAALEHPPRCVCGGLIRPDVVWFGEPLPPDAVRDAWEAARRCDLFFSIGTSGEVYPAAQLPSVAREAGAWVVEINPRASSIAHRMHECIEAPSGTVLPVILETARRLRSTA